MRVSSYGILYRLTIYSGSEVASSQHDNIQLLISRRSRSLHSSNLISARPMSIFIYFPMNPLQVTRCVSYAKLICVDGTAPESFIATLV